jgi:hypothetical protein
MKPTEPTPRSPLNRHSGPNVRPPMRKVPSPTNSASPSKPNNPQAKTIEVRLHLPDIPNNRYVRRVVARSRRTSRKQRLLLGIGILGLIGIFYATGPLRAETTTATKNGTENPLSKLERGTPKYATLLPSGKSIQQLGGWTRISPPEREPVYAYVDKIGPIPVSVSQQPLPDSFKNETDKKIGDVALSHNATRKIDAGGIKAYIGASSDGPQSVIFTKRSLLILIKSTGTVSDEEWQDYIKSLG